MSTLEFSVVINCPVETVFAVYTDVDRDGGTSLDAIKRVLIGDESPSTAK